MLCCVLLYYDVPCNTVLLTVRFFVLCNPIPRDLSVRMFAREGECAEPRDAGVSLFLATAVVVVVGVICE